MPRVLTALCLLSPGLAFAQAPAKPPAPRALGAIEAKSAELLGAVSTARALSDGRVLINDAIGRRVLLFDKTLATYTVVADTTAATGNAYSGRFGGLLTYKGDTSLFVDPQAMSMLVIDPSGKIGRVMSVPRPNDAQALVAGQNGIPGFDAQGRLVYRAPFQLRFGPGGPGGPGAAAGRGGQGGQGGTPGQGAPAFRMPDIPDSAAIVRVELATRKLDTVAFIKTQKIRMKQGTDTSGRMMMTPIIDPLPKVDDWAVLSNGAVAIVRGMDYHVDWIKGDDARASSERLPFDWRHLNDSAKAAFLDSTRVAMEKVRANFMAQMKENPGRMPQIPGMDGAMGGGAPVMVMRFEGGPPGGPPRQSDNARARDETGGPPRNFTLPPLTFVEPNELPDYAPPFTTGAARADQDGNLWVRTSIVVNGGPIYDVIDANGTLVERVAVPAGRVIAGFGKGGVVYMGVRDGAGVRLEQARRTIATP
ncbi:MAG: hypothetical protein IT359_12045 [Gemmatimonadaceae bacterium]|nr:hypothetical protein [Gemmatimonadaceae bacterium]